MIYIGNQTACWAASPTEPFDYALANGFDAFEWFPDKKPAAGWDESDLDLSRRRLIRESANAHAIRLSVHARWQANPVQPASGPVLEQDLELAQDLGAALLNIHLYHEAGLPAFVEAIAPLFRRVAQAGLQLAIENTPEQTPAIFNELFERLRALNPPLDQIGMCLDLGHANLCAATRNDYLRFIDRLDSQVPIIHLHLHENWGDADSHLPLFTGPAARDDAGIRGLLERLQERRFTGSIILEQWPNPPALLNQARDRLLQLLGRSASVGSPPSPSGESPVGARTFLSAGGGMAAEADKNVRAPSTLGFFKQLVDRNQHAASWREKLDLVLELLSSESAPTTEQLVDVAVFLRFLSTGQLPCAEDGRHFRPAHHARISLQIQERLASLTAPEARWLVRQILPWLPSSAEIFRRPEPLTRIRDLAHRNDLPTDLKREIKHSLQNKLHRCAGPEDLATSAALLERISAPGSGCSPDFVSQFRIFHDELKEFFNARSLDERLEALLPNAQPDQANLIRSFIRQKSDRSADASSARAAFESLTQLRRSLLNTVAQAFPAAAQPFRLADIALEDFAFVLLSRLLNALETAGPEARTTALPALLSLTLDNLALSSIAPAECQAISAELRSGAPLLGAPASLPASADTDLNTRESLLRLKAIAERSRRLAEDYSDRLLALFPPRAAKLGRALGLSDHAIRVFGEAEIRGHLVFQLSKLVSLLLRDLRESLVLPTCDVLVAGRAVGRLQIADRLTDLNPEPREPVLALLKYAEGDEEIPNGFTGIVLAREIPHLSHLGVRARQAGVVLIACAEPADCESLRNLVGQEVLLTATPEKVEWAVAPTASVGQPFQAAGEPGFPARRASGSWRITHADSLENPPCKKRPNSLRTNATQPRPWLPLAEALPETSGGKASGARQLAELASRKEADFLTPSALVIPFGIMEAALDATPHLGTPYRELLNRIDNASPEDAASLADSLRNLTRQLNVPAEILSAVAKEFGPNSRLMVRSSANCEDLDDLAGAGLYESVANVAPADLASAVQTVWSSLWTRRTTLARRQAGIPHTQVRMAVLIQQMLVPDYSFILHTVNPINHQPREVYAELAVGLGETLASAAAQGTPYRLLCHKESGAVTTLAFASFNHALEPSPSGGTQGRMIDYSQISLSCDPQARRSLGRRLAGIGRFVEQAFGRPQDIEGVVLGPEIYLVQARAQQGL